MHMSSNHFDLDLGVNTPQVLTHHSATLPVESMLVEAATILIDVPSKKPNARVKLADQANKP